MLRPLFALVFVAVAAPARPPSQPPRQSPPKAGPVPAEGRAGHLRGFLAFETKEINTTLEVGLRRVHHQRQQQRQT